MVKIQKSQSTKRFSIDLVYSLTQGDEKLLICVKNFFNCGNVYRKGNVFDFVVTIFDDIVNKIIPFFNRIPNNGKAMKPGIKVTDPKNEASVMPTNLFLSPRYFKIISSGMIKRIIETRISMLKKAGKILINFLTAILTALDVLSGFLKTEIKRANRVSIYK